MHRVLSRHRPLLIRDDRLFASRGLDLYVSDDFGNGFVRVARCRLPWARRTASRVPLFERAGRLGFHALREMPGGAMVAIVRRRVVLRSESGGDFRAVSHIPRGSRPLNLCLDEEGRVYFGEYFANPRRDEVRVYGSSDGRHWEIAHRFPAGLIRHVHAVVGDRYRGGLWVLSGDDDRECGLWFTDDGFRTLEPVVRGDQRFRAVSVIPTEDGLIVPTDSPRIRNWIQLLTLPEMRLEKLHPLPGSAFSAVRCGGLLLVSTASEPSPVNREPAATVHASFDSYRWRRIASFPPDLLSRALPFAHRLLRYPQIGLTAGEDTTPYAFGYGRSVRHAEGRLVRWSRSEIRKALGRPSPRHP